MVGLFPRLRGRRRRRREGRYWKEGRLVLVEAVEIFDFAFHSLWPCGRAFADANLA